MFFTETHFLVIIDAHLSRPTIFTFFSTTFFMTRNLPLNFGRGKCAKLSIIVLRYEQKYIFNNKRDGGILFEEKEQTSSGCVIIYCEMKMGKNDFHE